MSLNFKTNNRNLIIEINGDIDHHTSQLLKDKIDLQLQKDNIKNIIFDFSGVNFMDSSGLGLIMGRYRNINTSGGRVILTNVSPQLNRIFNLAGLYRIMDQYADVNEALEAL